MNVSGAFKVDVPREIVFRTICDARTFASFLEGVQDLKEIDSAHYEFETKIAYLKFRFAVTVEVTRIEAPCEIEAMLEGNPLGIVGRLVAKSITRLVEAGNETEISYSVETMLTGRLGSIGQPVLRAKAKEMERQFINRLRAAFTTQRAVK